MLTLNQLLQTMPGNKVKKFIHKVAKKITCDQSDQDSGKELPALDVKVCKVSKSHELELNWSFKRHAYTTFHRMVVKMQGNMFSKDRRICLRCEALYDIGPYYCRDGGDRITYCR